MHSLTRFSFCARHPLGLACLIGALAGGSACSSRNDERPAASDQAEAEYGSLRLSLTARGASGALYRLRQATFNVFTLFDEPFPFPEPDPFPQPVPVPPDFGFPVEGDIEEVDPAPARDAGSAGTSSASGGMGGSSMSSGAIAGAAGAPSSGGSGTISAPPGVPGTGGFAGTGDVVVDPPRPSPGGPTEFIDEFLFSEDNPTASTLETDLPAGQFGIQLFGGWFLEKVVDGEAVTVDARLVSSEFQTFEIRTNDETRVSYRFETGGEVVDFGQGRLIVDIEVDEVEGGGGNDPVGRVLQTNVDTVNAAFGNLEQVLSVALTNAGSSLDALTAYHSIIDSYNTQAAGRDPEAPHCDDELTNGSPSLNGFRMDCPRLEGDQFDNLGSWFPTAASNRLDLAPEDGANCGQQRIVFANSQFIGNGRMFMILEAQIPNPTPECGVAACRPIAEFWDRVGSESDPVQRGIMLSQAYLSGEPSLLESGFEPFMNASRLGPEGGQIRTNNFNDFVWTLREFQFQDDINARPLPVGVAESPNGQLWNDLSGLPQGEECRDNFLEAMEGLLTDELNAMSFPVAEICKNSESRNDFSDDYPGALRSGSGQFADRLAEAAAPFGLSANDIAARAQFAGSCMGCHIETGGLNLGQGLVAPFREDFVHISEFLDLCPDGSGFNCFGISSALRDVFVPHRNQVLSEVLEAPICGGGVVDPPPDLPPIVGEPGPDQTPIELPEDPAPIGDSPAPTPRPLVRTLGGALATPHAH